MQAQARAGRYWLLLAMLLVLVTVSAPPAPGRSDAGQSASVSGATPVYNELHDRPRGSVSAGHTANTAAPDSWWVVYQGATGGYALKARGPASTIVRAAARSSLSTSRSSRAPPRA